MANAVIWPGSSSFFPGDTPFGFYDYEYDFQVDADRVATFCATRLGYPITDVELQAIHFYTAFEEAVTTYGNELYAFRVRQDYLSMEGASTGSAFNNQILTPNMGGVIRMSQQYGVEAGVGGSVPFYSGSIALKAGQQIYDLNAWARASASIATNDSIEIKRVFYEAPPAIMRYFDPYAGTGTGMMQMLDNFGWGGYSPAINFLMMPINYDLQKLQAIEFNDQIRKSQYSFELVNNKLKVFPIPSAGTSSGTAGYLWFEYVKNSERNNPLTSNAASGSKGLVSDVSNVPYDNPKYTYINSIGRQWIYEYTLALVRDTLAQNRGKYSQIPIPGAVTSLNAADLHTDARSEKTALIERLRGYFEDTSREKLLERKAAETEARSKELNQVPLLIFIG